MLEYGRVERPVETAPILVIVFPDKCGMKRFKAWNLEHLFFLDIELSVTFETEAGLGYIVDRYRYSFAVGLRNLRIDFY